MTPDDLREFCLALPQATETYPFGEETSVFKTSGNDKIFAIASLDVSPLSVSLKCDPEESLALREAYPEITPGYHLNKKHWITVVLGDSVVGDSVVGDAVSGEGAPGDSVPGEGAPGEGAPGDSAPGEGTPHDGVPHDAAPHVGVPDELVQQLLQDSHALVRPKIPRARG